MRHLKLIAILGVMAACTDMAAPIDGVRLDITAEYRQWWGELEACSGLQGNIDNVRFYSVPSLSGGVVGRIWYGGSPLIEIVSVNPQAWTHVGWAVKHEMMHALLNRSGHPVEYFDGRCGNLTKGDWP